MIDEAAHQREAVFGGMDEKLPKWALSRRWRKELMITVIKGFFDIVASWIPLVLGLFRNQGRRGQFREFRRCGLSDRATKFQDTGGDSVTTSMLKL